MRPYHVSISHTILPGAAVVPLAFGNTRLVFNRRAPGGTSQIATLDEATAAAFARKPGVTVAAVQPDVEDSAEPGAPPAVEWTLSVSPEAYIAKHGDAEAPSEKVAENLALARAIVGGGG